MSSAAKGRSSRKSKTTDGSASVNAPNGTIDEKTLIESGLSKLGITGDYDIVIADTPDIVETTAAETLQKFLGKAGLNVRIVPESKATGKKRFLLGRDSNLKAITCFSDSGKLKIRDVSAEDDGFHLKRIGDDIAVAGANPRGVLYGVYAFEDFVTAGATGSLDIKKVPYYRKRGSAPGYYWNQYVNFWTEEFPEEKAAYLSRLGVNQMTSDDTALGKLSFLVQSDIFPFQTPPKAETQRKFKALAAICKKYGIDYYMMLWEPLLPGINGDLKKYPKDALGTVKRPWGGDKDGLDTTLCVNSPIVQKHYRNLMRKFVREYPDVKGVFMYNMDGESWLCTPALCARCKTACKDSPANEHNPWETQARLVTVLAAAAHEENPDFDFRFWGTVHYHGERCDKLLHAAQGYNSLLSAWHGSDHDIMVPDVAQPAPAFISSRNECTKRAVPLYASFEFNNLESVPRSLPFPFHVCDAIQKHKAWGVTCIEEHVGPIPGHNPINALVMKEFLSNPDQRPERFLSSLATRQFGKTAGAWMYKAWKEMEQAFDVWNDHDFNPLSGSQAYLSLGTPSGIPRAILPDIVKSYNNDVDIRITVEPFRASSYQSFKEKALLDKMVAMNAHLAQAAQHARQAVVTASDKAFIGICYYDGANGRPTCKEYAELNYAPMALADAFCRQRCNILRAYHVLTDLDCARAAGQKKIVQLKEKQYRDLIRKDIGVQEHFCELLTHLAAMRPCYTRTSLTEREIADFLGGTRAKIAQLAKFLKGTESSRR